MITTRNRWLGLLSFLVSAMLAGVPASAQQQQKPNILVIMGDDIGYWNISAYNRGMMGYRTPNIDRTRAKLLVVLPIVISIAFMLVADIDTPRHGIVRVSPQNLTSLAESLRAQ
jgi:hypothetical protein